MANNLTKLGASLALALTLSPSSVLADWVHARCDVYSAGEDHTNVSLPCVFSQRQGYVTIERSDGISYELSPRGDHPGNYTDKNGQLVYRNSGLGKSGLIFRLTKETVYVYWDTAGLPGTIDNATRYSTKNFDATASIDCTLADYEDADAIECAIGVNRGPQPGQAVVAIMRPDGIERVLQFDGEQVASPGVGKVQARLQSDLWTISIDGNETYSIPLAVIEGG